MSTHQQAIQILPINDTTITNTWMDSYPYNSISIYAFHPMYIDLRQLGKLKDKEALAFYEEKRKELNALPQIDYEAVNNTKRAYLKSMYQQTGKKCWLLPSSKSSSKKMNIGYSLRCFLLFKRSIWYSQFQPMARA